MTKCCRKQSSLITIRACALFTRAAELFRDTYYTYAHAWGILECRHRCIFKILMSHELRVSSQAALARCNYFIKKALYVPEITWSYIYCTYHISRTIKIKVCITHQIVAMFTPKWILCVNIATIWVCYSHFSFYSALRTLCDRNYL